MNAPTGEEMATLDKEKAISSIYFRLMWLGHVHFWCFIRARHRFSREVTSVQQTKSMRFK